MFNIDIGSHVFLARLLELQMSMTVPLGGPPVRLSVRPHVYRSIVLHKSQHRLALWPRDVCRCGPTAMSVSLFLLSLCNCRMRKFRLTASHASRRYRSVYTGCLQTCGIVIMFFQSYERTSLSYSSLSLDHSLLRFVGCFVVYFW